MKNPIDLMRDMGSSKYQEDIRKATQSGRVSETKAGTQLLRQAVPVLSEEIRKFRRSHSNRNNVTRILRGTSNDLLAMLTMRVMIDSIAQERLFHQTVSKVGAAVEDELLGRAMKKLEPRLFKDLKADLKYTGEGRTRKAYTKAAIEHALWIRWDYHTRGAVGIVLTQLAVDCTGFFDVKLISGRKSKKKWLEVKPEVLTWLDGCHEHHAELAASKLPLVTPPEPWVDQWTGGFPDTIHPYSTLIKAKRQKHQELYGPDECPEVYEALNHLQGAAWNISPVPLAALKVLWDEGNAIGGLPKRDDDVIERLPDELREDEETWNNHRALCRAVHRQNRSQRSSRLQTNLLMMNIGLYENEEFYFVHGADFRGRVYPSSGFMNYQGSDRAKGCLEFAESSMEIVGPNTKWVMNHTANLWGLDKDPVNEKVEWFEGNQELIIKVAEDPTGNREWLDADEPFQFLNACANWKSYRDGKGYRSPIAFDGTNNGLQILSAVLRDPVGAFSTNLTNCVDRQDIYMEVAHAATSVLRTPDSDYAVAWIKEFPEGLPRGIVKRPVMTQPYGLSKHSARDYVHDFMISEFPSLMAGEWRHDGFRKCVWLADIIWDSIKVAIPKARELMDWLQGAMKVCAKHGVMPTWEMPSGFKVCNHYGKVEKKKIQTVYKDRRLTLYANTDTLKPSMGKLSNAAVANWVHSIDAQIMHRTTLKCREEGIKSLAMTHDSFACPAHQSDILYRKTREAAVEIFEEPLVQNLKDDIDNQLPLGVTLSAPPAPGDFDVREILASPYFFI